MYSLKIHILVECIRYLVKKVTFCCLLQRGGGALEGDGHGGCVWVMSWCWCVTPEQLESRSPFGASEVANGEDSMRNKPKCGSIKCNTERGKHSRIDSDRVAASFILVQFV